MIIAARMSDRASTPAITESKKMLVDLGIFISVFVVTRRFNVQQATHTLSN